MKPPYLPNDPETLYQPEQPLDWSTRTLHPLPPVFEALPFGSIRPKGWLLAQLKRDLHEGFVGVMDRIVPTIFADDLFNRDRRSRLRDSAETGSSWSDEGIWADVEMKWWNAETQGNWWDGFLRTALLSGDPDALRKAEAWVESILQSQDEDGYLGVYAPDLRFRHEAENGELWALATVGRALLAWAQARDEDRVLQAVIRATDCAMQQSLRKEYHLFAVREPWGGITHNLMLTDVLISLHRLTGEERFSRYALEMFRQFSEHPTRNDDLCLCHLADCKRPFYKHGAHVYEHLRVLLHAWRLSGFGDLASAWDQALEKLHSCLSLSGGGIGFEDICGAEAHPETTPMEMCSIAELQFSLTEALFALGNSAFGDQVERCLFNAGFGQRSPDQKGLTYLRSDTQWQLDSREPDGTPNPRFKLSPAHQDCAVCCAPNSAKALPYYIGAMAGLDAEGIVLLLHGPCEVRAVWKGVPVTLSVETDYPFKDILHITVECQQPVGFSLKVRIPKGANPAASIPGVVKEDYLVLRVQGTRTSIELSFGFQPVWQRNRDGSSSAAWGNLVFAAPIQSRLDSLKEHPVPGFADYHAFPVLPAKTLRRASSEPELRIETSPLSLESNPWAEPPVWMKTALLAEGKPTAVALIPLAASVLRQAHFEKDLV